MPLKYNQGQRGMVVPNVLSRTYRYSSWQGNIVLKVTPKGRGAVTISINPTRRIAAAWRHIEKRCAAGKNCNRYFSSLHKGQTLSDILKNVTFTVHQLVPKPGVDIMKLPNANSAGNDFALSLWSFLADDATKENTTEALAATILHELAHYAGATTNPGAKNALEAENALLHCGLKRFFNPKAKG